MRISIHQWRDKLRQPHGVGKMGGSSAGYTGQENDGYLFKLPQGPSWLRAGAASCRGCSAADAAVDALVSDPGRT